MSFKLYKASGSRVPDLVSDIGAGATIAASIASSAAYQIQGRALQIVAADGDLELAVTNVAVAGIGAAEYKGSNGSLYAAASGGATATFPHGLVEGTKLPFLPVTGTVLITADVKADTIALADGLPGATLDIETGGLILTTSSNADFRIIKVLEAGATYVTKVAGFFITPGYFTA